tara:strand:- start:13560 stop:13706 length:147 start_codon:yes stop_codon:yes gene_type:complete
MPERAARDMELRLKKALRLFVYSALTLCELERVWLRIEPEPGNDPQAF